MSNKDLENEVREYQKLFGDVKSEIAKVVVGQEALVHRLLIGLITGGHVLVEGVPGLAKTLLIRTVYAGYVARRRDGNGDIQSERGDVFDQEGACIWESRVGG